MKIDLARTRAIVVGAVEVVTALEDLAVGRGRV
jgi:hypothetical protein